MKKIFYLLLLYSIAGNAQLVSFPTHTDKPVWGYLSQGGYLSSPIFSLYGLLGDTVINTLTYSKLYSFKDTILNKSNVIYFHGGMRVSDGKVYFYNIHSKQENLLYDFSKSINDTIKFNDIGDYAVIHKVDTIVLKGNIHKRFYLNDPNEGTGKWIENIGSEYGMLVNMLYPTDNNPPSTALTCFKYNAVNYYPGDDNCDCFNDYISLVTPVKNFGLNKNVLFFPNPISIDSKIQLLNGYKLISAIVFDMKGTKLIDREINSSEYFIYCYYIR